MPARPDEFRNLMGALAAGVTVATTVDAEGRAYGMTASSVTSVSLDPPLLLICVSQEADFHAAMLHERGFVINILAADQEPLSRRFSDRQVEDRFAGLEVRDENGLPLIEGAMAHIACRHFSRYEAGDHTIFFGLVVGGTVSDRPPLVHFRSTYTTTVAEDSVNR